MKAFHHAPLTEVEKSKIRALFKSGVNRKSLAIRFDVSAEAIREIVGRRTR